LTKLGHPRRSDTSKGEILDVLFKLKGMGKAERTLRSYGYRLKTIAKYVDLRDVEGVKQFISNIKGTNAYRESYVKAYNWYIRIKGLQWEKPKYRFEEKLPFVPNGEAIEKIIASSSRKYATIFRILVQTGAMPFELSQVTLKDIDLEKGTLNIRGYKGHASRIFKLKTQTLDMLRVYLDKDGKKEKHACRKHGQE